MQFALVHMLSLGGLPTLQAGTLIRAVVLGDLDYVSFTVSVPNKFITPCAFPLMKSFYTDRSLNYAH
jgi:hypothetical protein